MSLVDEATGEIVDTLVILRDLDTRIAAADKELGALKEQVKLARRHREGLVSELRAVARGERRLPLSDTPAGA